MATNYPGALDTFPTTTAATPMDEAGSEHDIVHNGLADAVEAIEVELGTNPSGSYETVAARLAAIGTGGSGNANIGYGAEPESPDVGEFWLDLGAAPNTVTHEDLGNAGATKTVDIGTADVQQLTLNAASVTLTLAGSVTTGFVRRWQLHLIHDATPDARAVVWPGSIKWPGGTEPTLLTSTASAVAVLEFITMPGATVTYGRHVGNFS